MKRVACDLAREVVQGSTELRSALPIVLTDGLNILGGDLLDVIKGLFGEAE